MLYDRVLRDILEKKEHKEKGGFNGVPVPFTKYSEYFDTFDKGNYIQLLGPTGSGKSKFKRHLIYSMVEFAHANDYPLLILDFSLEDSELQVSKTRMTHYLWKRHNVDLSQKYLDSRETPLDQKYIDLIQKDELFWRKFEHTVAVIDYATSPNQIHEQCEKAYEKYGKTHHIICFFDNYANIIRDDSDESEWAAVRRFSRNIVRLRLCKTLGMTCIGILQQD